MAYGYDAGNPNMPRSRVREHAQWAYAATVQPNGGIAELTGTPLTWRSNVFPFAMPSDRWLCITHIAFASKFGASGRASYLVLDGIGTLTDNHPERHFGDRAPFVVPSLDNYNAPLILTARFINNETQTPDYGVGSPVGSGGEAQVMNMSMVGYFIDIFPGMTIENCLEGLS